MENQYNVVILPESENALTGVKMVTQGILPYDRSGNPYRWVFSREEIPYVGNGVVFKTLDQETADLVFNTLDDLADIRVLPVHESLREH